MTAIIGASALGRLVANILKLNQVEITGFFDDDEKKQGKKVDGVSVVGPVSDLFSLGGKTKLIIAVGDVQKRKRLFKKFKKVGYNFANAIHPSASIASSVTLGEGVIIKENAVLEIGVKISDNVIIGNGSVICHDSKLGSHCRIAPGVTIAGYVTIDDEVYIGVNVSVDRTLTIGKKSVIASGCTIWKDVPCNSFVKLPHQMDVKEVV